VAGWATKTVLDVTTVRRFDAKQGKRKGESWQGGVVGQWGDRLAENDLTNQTGSLITIQNQRKFHIMTAFTVRVPDETASKLDQLAEKLERSRAYVAAQAIEDFVAREAWQLAEIEAGLAEADRGEFANDAELARVVGKYVNPARQA
jgi:predicted transcriptional regulator